MSEEQTTLSDEEIETRGAASPQAAFDDSDDSGDDSGDEDWSDEDSGGCSTDTLKPGAVVNEADVSYTGKGAFFDAIELAR